MIIGTTKIDGRYWLILLPNGGGKRKDAGQSQFNKMIELAGKENFHTEMATLCTNLAHENRIDDEGNCWSEFGFVTRRDEQECNWDVIMPSRGTLGVGFRPMFVPLKSAAGAPDSEYMAQFADGDSFDLGTLYMDGIALPTPQNPIGCLNNYSLSRSGDCPTYKDGSYLRLGDAAPDPSCRIKVVKTGNCFISDRVILGAISYNQLHLYLSLTKYRGAKKLIEEYLPTSKVTVSGYYNVDSGEIES